MNRLLLLGSALLLVLSGCGGGGSNGNADTTAPTATLSAQSGATLKSSDSLVIEFSEAMDTSSLSLSGTMADRSDGGSWSTTTNSNDTLTISPSAGWDAAAGSMGLIVDVSDVAGNALSSLNLTYKVRIQLSTFQAASIVVGQPDFVSKDVNQGGSAAGNTFNRPYGGIGYGDGKLFLSDWSNHRVLVFDGVPTTNNVSASFALGQTDLVTTTSGLSDTKFNGPGTSVVDGDRLLVFEFLNHRALIFQPLPTNFIPTASVVVGQADFTSNTSGCTQSNLNSPEGGIIAGGKLLVTDVVNHRVLIWNDIPTANGVSPDLVLGQNSFTTCASNDDDQNGVSDASPSARTFTYPGNVWSDATRLVVTDSANHRVLIWNTFPTVNFQPADVVLGQSNFTNAAQNGGNAGPTASSLFFPYIGVTSNGNQLFVSDEFNHRVLIWNTFPTENGQAADVVLGQSDFSHNTLNDDNQDGIEDANPTARTFGTPSGLLLVDDKLIVQGSNNSRYLIFQGQ